MYSSRYRHLNNSIRASPTTTTAAEKGTKGGKWGGYCDGSLAVMKKVYWSLPGLLPWALAHDLYTSMGISFPQGQDELGITARWITDT